jgi:nitrogen fixation/metabolism regulation signal transduction histidine kinase
VLSLDRYHSITRINPAVFRLFGPRPLSPQRLEDLFPADSLRELRHLLRRSERLGAVAGQMEVPVQDGRILTTAVTVASIPGDSGGRRSYSGYVLVFDDLTDLLRIQRVAAWREVARRIAHEIKNPLTPISLSAQRIHRRLERYQAALPPAPGVAAPPPGEDGMLAVIAECADTINSEVHSLQRLVDEFSAFARFPAARPIPCNLNDVIESALRAFDGRLDGITIRTQLRPLPLLKLDPEDMKRLFINLIDNAAEAMRQSPYREILLSTAHLEGTVEAVVADTGRGVQPGDKEKLFLPYYSTKGRGTGLGLAIVTKIVEDHGGSIRIEENLPVGARFILELPVPEADETCPQERTPAPDAAGAQS